MKLQKGLSGTAFENGYKIVQDRGLAIIGMSPGNSYFKKDQIDKLLKYCSKIFGQIRIMVADKPMEHTYLARGYDIKKAERKARLNGNTLQNHSQRTIDEILGDVKLIEWKDEITPHESYQSELNKIEGLYGENKVFREEVRNTTRTVLEGKLKQGIAMNSAVDKGIYYLLKELAFLSASPKIFETKGMTYVYHDQWKVYEHFVDGKFDGQKRSDLGFVIVK